MQKATMSRASLSQTHLFLVRRYAKSTVSLALIEKDAIEKILYNNQFPGLLIKSLAIDIDNKHPYCWS